MLFSGNRVSYIVSKKDQAWFPIHIITEPAAVVISIRNTNSKVALKAAMFLPHLQLHKTKSETNKSSSKSSSHYKNLWMQVLQDDELFTGANALRIRHSKEKKCEVNEQVRQFDKLISTSKISAAIGCLSDERTKRILS